MTLLPFGPLLAAPRHAEQMDCCQDRQAAPCHSALRAVTCCRTPEAPVVATASVVVSVMPERSVQRKLQAATAPEPHEVRTLSIAHAFERRQGRVAPLPPFLIDRALLL